MSNDAEYRVALAFAKLELIELEAGKRSLTQCPGLKNVARFITEAELKTSKAAERITRDAVHSVPHGGSPDCLW